MSREELSWMSVLFLIGFLTHVLFLSAPRQVIFDEVHFGKFITAYCCTHERFFDIHPPHAKLLIAGTAYLFGYRGGFDFDHIGEAYGNTPIAALRLFPALTGIALPLIVFILLRQLGASIWTAGLGSSAILLDNALLVQTRLIALDGILLMATFGSLSAFLAAERRKGLSFWGFSALAGALAALAVGTKFTGLASVILLGLLILYGLVRDFTWRNIQRRLLQIVILAVVFLGIYASGWALHFWLLNKPGPGDAWRVPQWQQPLAVSFWRETVALHQLMLSANYNLTATHPYASPWWEWPLMKKPVFYWQGQEGAVIYFVGNPVVWWGSTIGILMAVCSAALSPKKAFANYRWVPWAGFFIALLPMVRIPRALFLYHYLTPLFFALFIGLLWLDQVPLKRRHHLNMILGGLLILGWLIMMPVSYGFVIPVGWSHLVQNMLE